MAMSITDPSFALEIHGNHDSNKTWHERGSDYKSQANCYVLLLFCFLMREFQQKATPQKKSFCADSIQKLNCLSMTHQTIL